MGDFEQRFLSIISGERRGAGASLARAALRVAEPAYATAVRARNALYDASVKRSIRLPRPVVSVGNLTVGGTGKTPFVAWLAAELLARGVRPAVLMRGYRATADEPGDEQRLLTELLGGRVPVKADPDRARAAARAFGGAERIDVFLLDDGFQHRRVRRDVDLVLIDATRPFGYGHVLPRGLLREPPTGLRRATACIVTRASLVDAAALRDVTSAVQRLTDAPIFRCEFVADRITRGNGPDVTPAEQRIVAACGIGNPGAFVESLRRGGFDVAATRAFADHHAYSRADVELLAKLARDHGAGAVVTTTKDWTKLRSLWPAGGAVPAWVIHQRASMAGEEAGALVALVEAGIDAGR